MPSLGKIEEFNPATADIKRYMERLDQYFVANGVPADSRESQKRRATLISVIGAKAYDVLSDLCSPTVHSEKTYDELSTILKDHFAPRKLVIAERYRFHNCTQRDGESVSEFAANLKRLASTCQFGAALNEALRDRLVCGLRSREIQKKLLTEEYTFADALKNALSYEVAEKDIATFSHDGSASVNKVTAKQRQGFQHPKQNKPSGKAQRKPSPPSNGNGTSECLSCGKSGHPRSQCKFRSYTCHTCGKVGHISDACKGKKQKVNKVEHTESTAVDASQDPFSLSLYNLSSDKKGIEIPVELNGTKLLMELDTGAGVSIISNETYKNYLSDVPLKPSETRLHTYTGHPVQVTGQLEVHLKYNDQSLMVPLLVVDGSGPSLFGRDWLAQVKLD